MSEQTLSQIVETKLAKIIESGKVEEIVEEKVGKCLDEALGDLFSHWGGFGKLVKEEVKRAMPENLEGVMDLAPYSELVKGMLKNRLAAHFDANAQGLAEGLIDELMEAPPEAVTLSDLIESFIEYVVQHDHGDRGDWDAEPYIEIEEDLNHVFAGYWTVKFGTRKGYRGIGGYELRVDSRGCVYGFTLGLKSKESAAMGGVLNDFDKKIFQISACRVPLIRDPDFDPYDFCWPDQD